MYILPPLPYGPTALQPVIGTETMRTHHGKHHARYVQTVNDLLGASAGARPLEDVIAEARERGERKLFNNAAQAWNHAFFWESMTPDETAPAESLAKAIAAAFGSRSALQDKFVAEGCDVWEHAYYLDYKNERDRFLRTWFERLANWTFASAQYAAAAAEGEGAYRYPG
jgi:Fe-Mn family superoxide dismutase